MQLVQPPCAARAEKAFEVGFFARDQQALKKLMRRGPTGQPLLELGQARIAKHLANVFASEPPTSVVHIVLFVLNTVRATKSPLLLRSP
jgi:hypothetical protein